MGEPARAETKKAALKTTVMLTKLLPTISSGKGAIEFEV